VTAVELSVSVEGLAGPELLMDVFGGALAGRVLPAHLVEGPPGPAVEGERGLEAAAATAFEAPPVTWAWAEAARAGQSPAVWCALVAALPFGGPPERRAWLRSGLPPPAGRRALPFVTGRLLDDTLHLRFGVGGAPLLPPPRAESPWPEAARGAAAELGQGLRLLLEDGARVRLRTEDLDAAGRERLVAALDAGPRLEVDLSDPERSLARLSPVPGPCRACRHANQGTFDLEQEGLLACSLAGSRLGRPPRCDVELEVDGARGFAFEPWDGGNGTWGREVKLALRAPRRPPRR
jgi:hypothetical protein